jgi:hypothetical protein
MTNTITLFTAALLSFSVRPDGTAPSLKIAFSEYNTTRIRKMLRVRSVCATITSPATKKSDFHRLTLFFYSTTGGAYEQAVRL